MSASKAKALPSVSNPYPQSSVVVLLLLRIENKTSRIKLFEDASLDSAQPQNHTTPICYNRTARIYSTLW